jgi:hypothetical protein
LQEGPRQFPDLSPLAPAGQNHHSGDQRNSVPRQRETPARFMFLARSVYQLNDHRAQLKRRINEWCGSPWMEEKEYTAQASQ